MAHFSYTQDDFGVASTRINADMFTDDVRVYAVNGSRTRRCKSRAKALKLIDKGYRIFGTYEAWKSVGLHVIKGEKSKYSCAAGSFFTAEQVGKTIPRSTGEFVGWPDQDDRGYWEHLGDDFYRDCY